MFNYLNVCELWLEKLGVNIFSSILICVTFYLIGFSANAGELGVNIVKNTRLVEQLDSSRRACEIDERRGDIEGIAIANPSMFNGISPKSSVWPEARAAYIRYALSTCVPRDIQSYIDVAASIYDSKLSEKEQIDILNFLRTGAGKKFSFISDSLSEALNRRMYDERQESLRKSRVEFSAEIYRLNKEARIPIP